MATWLAPVPAGAWIVDGTVGLGGHAARAPGRPRPAARLLGLDRDGEPAGSRVPPASAPYGARVTLRHADYRELGPEAAACGIEAAHAILFDLGLSSDQLARSGRGFSFQADERLDMRFDTRQGLTAAEILRRTPEPDLVRPPRRLR